MWKRIVLVLAVILVVLQFFRPVKNVSAGPASQDDFLVRHPAPEEVRRIFTAACYDCHSNNTRYPWYAEVQPFAAWLADHVADGKTELNLSDFGSYTVRRQGQKIDAMIDEIEGRSMPLKSYTLMHRDANLTDAQVTLLVNWLEEEREKLEDAD